MLYLCYLCRFKPLRDHLRGFLIAAWAGDKIAEFSFPEISFHFPLRPWFFFVSPAYAGKSATSRPAAISRLGSPPRMRGKGLVCLERDIRVGITPACAGKRPMHSISCLSCRDHPRVCGEKAFVRSCCASRTGSPPRMRGKVARFVRLTFLQWITPAYAGKRSNDCNSTSKRKDHPRVCGEKWRVRMSRTDSSGSPPRMRGKGCTTKASILQKRITPAYAGKSRALFRC